MASADDPLANAYNIMGAQGLTDPNPYLEYTGQIPMAGFMGTPTDASGKPIQSYLQAMQGQGGGAGAPGATPGTTLNSPASGAQFPTGSPLWQGQQSGASPAAMQAMFSQLSPTIPGTNQTNPNYAPSMMAMMGGAGGGGAGAPVPAAAQPTGAPNQRQAYLDALSNPGPVTTPGAVMQPGATTGAAQPSVLQAFLAAHPQGGTSVSGKGGGGYSNQSFFNTLANLQAAKGAAA